ncbi:MAG: helicase-related protein [Anaerolineae bacterium]
MADYKILGDRFFTDLERFSANYPQSLIQPKIDAMQEHATKYLSEGHKILVFSQFNETTRYVFNQLKRTDLGEFCFLYDESVSDVEKANVIRQFRRTNSGILLCPGEVSEGLNLQFASVMINLDLPWDPMKIEQRIGRIQRIGGSAEIFIVNLVLKGTLEEEILSILEHKIRMFEAVVGKVEEIIGNLSDAEDFRIMIGNLYLNRQVEIQEDSEDDIHQVTANVFIEHAIDSAVNRTEQGKDQLNSIFMEGLDGEEHHVNDKYLDRIPCKSYRLNNHKLKNL